MVIPTIDMGLNTLPKFELNEEIMNKTFETEEEQKRYEEHFVKHHVRQHEKALQLKKEIEEAIAEYGSCYLSFSCEGRIRHQWQSEAWADAMPEFNFKIGYNYYCLVSKKEQ